MKRRFYAVAVAVAVAAMSAFMVVGTSSADVARYQTQTYTFTAIQPYGAVGQWQNVWTHNFTVTVNPCDGTFTGTGKQYDNQGAFFADETVTGSFNGNTINLNVTRPSDNVAWSLTNAPTDDNTVTLATTDPVVPWNVEFKVSQPKFTGTSTFKNHGEYVSSMGGGDDAAHSCIGMPIVSHAGA
jgi:hypothetical protein